MPSSFPYIFACLSLSLLFRQSLLYDSQFNISIRTRLISTRGLWMTAGDGTLTVPGRHRPSNRHSYARTGRTVMEASRPSWQDFGRHAVPGRRTGRLRTLFMRRAHSWAVGLCSLFGQCSIALVSNSPPISALRIIVRSGANFSRTG